MVFEVIILKKATKRLYRVVFFAKIFIYQTHYRVRKMKPLFVIIVITNIINNYVYNYLRYFHQFKLKKKRNFNKTSLSKAIAIEKILITKTIVILKTFIEKKSIFLEYENSFYFGYLISKNSCRVFGYCAVIVYIYVFNNVFLKMNLGQQIIST